MASQTGLFSSLCQERPRVVRADERLGMEFM